MTSWRLPRWLDLSCCHSFLLGCLTLSLSLSHFLFPVSVVQFYVGDKHCVPQNSWPRITSLFFEYLSAEIYLWPPSGWRQPAWGLIHIYLFNTLVRNVWLSSLDCLKVSPWNSWLSEDFDLQALDWRLAFIHYAVSLEIRVTALYSACYKNVQPFCVLASRYFSSRWNQVSMPGLLIDVMGTYPVYFNNEGFSPSVGWAARRIPKGFFWHLPALWV